MESDPRQWTEEQIVAFSSEATEEELLGVHRTLLNAGDAQAIAVLQRFLGARHDALYSKGDPSQLAARALIGLGPVGVEALAASLLDDEQRVRYAPSLVELLWEVGRTGKLAQTKAFGLQGFLDLDLPADTQQAASRAVRDIFAQATIDPHAFWLVTMFAQHHGLSADLAQPEKTEPGEAAREFMSLFAEATIKLSLSVLDEFRELINEEHQEEEYQQFLAQNPVLLDPLAAEVVPKQSLGGELATDYAIRRHDDRWILVEIERPQDHPFTQGNDFRTRFVHGFGQVLDFQSWVDSNVAFAQKQMPGIVTPRGMLVIGLRSRLDDSQRQKLTRFADNSQRIEISTFDDLLARGESLYESLHHRPRSRP